MAQRCDASESGAWFGVTADLAVVLGIAAFTVGAIATGLGVLDPAGHVLPGYVSEWALPERKTLRATSRPVDAADCCAKSSNTAPFDPAPTDRPRNDRPIVAPHADGYRGKTEPLPCEDDLREFLIRTAAWTHHSASIRNDSTPPDPAQPFVAVLPPPSRNVCPGNDHAQSRSGGHEAPRV